MQFRSPQLGLNPAPWRGALLRYKRRERKGRKMARRDRDRDDAEGKQKKGFFERWGDNIASGSVGFLQRRIETSMEDRLLKFIRANPWVRMYYERHGPITVDLLSMTLKGMPDPGNEKTFFGKLLHEGKDIAEIIPREIARILDNRLDLQPGMAPVGPSGQPPASFVALAKFLEPDLRPHLPAFIGFYKGLTDAGQRAVLEAHILSRATADIVAFMTLTVYERVEMIKLLTSPAPAVQTLEEEAARLAQTAQFNARVTEVLEPANQTLRQFIAWANRDLPRN